MISSRSTCKWLTQIWIIKLTNSNFSFLIIENFDKKFKNYNKKKQNCQLQSPLSTTATENPPYLITRTQGAIEKEESKPLVEILSQLNGWPLLDLEKWNETNFDLIDTLIRIKNFGYSHLTLFSIHPGVDIKNNTNYLINVSLLRDRRCLSL